LRTALGNDGLILGLLSDQNGGPGGVKGPFLGLECSTSRAPALLALRYDAPLHVAICYRIAPARWQIEVHDEIPTRKSGRARRAEEITADLNRIFEQALHRDPANWFWVHNRWELAK
jgi:KDO2-lipid IV(A) lauroyltransferase